MATPAPVSTTVQPQDPANLQPTTTNQTQQPAPVQAQDAIVSAQQNTQETLSAVDGLREFINSLFQTIYDQAVNLVRLVTCGIICAEERTPGTENLPVENQTTQSNAPVENQTTPVNAPVENPALTQTNTQTQELQQPVQSTETNNTTQPNTTQPVVQQTAQEIFDSINSESNTYAKMLSLTTQLTEAEGSEENIKTLLKIERDTNGVTVESGPFSLQLKFAVAYRVFIIEQGNGNAVDGEAFIQNNPRHQSVKNALNDVFLALPQSVYTANRQVFDNEATANDVKFEALKNLINLNLNPVHAELNNHAIGDATFTEEDLKAGILASINKLESKPETAVIVNHLVAAYQGIVNATDIDAAKAQLLADVRHDQVKQAAQNAPALTTTA